MKKQTITFTLTESQSKRWAPVLSTKEGIQSITKALKELAKLQKYKEQQELKRKQELPQNRIPEGENYKMHHWKQYEQQVKLICELSKIIYLKFPYSGKEHHYQAALEGELRDIGFLVQQEVTRLLHYNKNNGEKIQLPHDIRGREDLNLPREKLILELKQTSKLTDKEFNQICRYMQERSENSSWGTDTRGMLINFGDTQLECWYLFYDKTNGRISRVQVMVFNTPPLDTLIDTFYH